MAAIMRIATMWSALFVLALPGLTMAQQAPSGAAVYKQHCAGVPRGRHTAHAHPRGDWRR